MSQMSSTVITHNLNPAHSPRIILVPAHSAWDGIEERWPATPRLELVRGFVERSGAASAGVDAGGRRVLVVFADIGRFGALFAEDAELFWIAKVMSVMLCYAFATKSGGSGCVANHITRVRMRQNIPGLSTACHSFLVLLTGKDISCFGVDVKKDEMKPIDGL